MQSFLNKYIMAEMAIVHPSLKLLVQTRVLKNPGKS